MSEEIKIDRLERIMEVAKMMRDELMNRGLLRLARQASDIYATAKEEIEARSMLKEETVTDCNQLPKLTVEVFDRPDCPRMGEICGGR